jgi:hypothetical protein
MRRYFRKLLLPLVTVLVLGWVGLGLAQNSSGGAFVPGFNYVIGGQWTWRSQASPFIFEGTTDDTFETTFTVTNPTADATITFQNATGTVMVAPAATSGAIASGTAALDGSNPTSVTTGLSVILACTITLQDATAPGDDIAVFSVQTTASAGRLDVYAWEYTSGTDATLVASNAQDLFQWICNGTR